MTSLVHNNHVFRAITGTSFVCIALTYLYFRRKFRTILKVHFDPIPLPEMEDYCDKTKSGLSWVLGAGILPPGEQLEAYKKMGMPKYFKCRIVFVPWVASTVKEDTHVASKRKSLTYHVYRPFLGYHSILFQEGAKARKEREMLNKGFSQQTYRSMHSVMIRASQRLIERMVHETEKYGHFDAEHLTSRATLEIIAEGGFSFEADKAENVVYLEALKRLMRIPGNPICLLPYGSALVQWWNRDAMRKVQELLSKTVTDRLNSTREQGDAADLLDLVIKASKTDGDEPNVVWIRDQLNLLFIAGSDTSSVALWWAMILLGKHPEIQTKMKAEIKDVFARVSNSFDRIGQLPYLEGFIKEVLRLYPPIPTTSRRLDDDETEFAGIPMTNFSWNMMGYSHFLAHRRPDYFPNPDALIPERWQNGQADTEAFASFSSGFRGCLGKNFAMVEMKTVLSSVLQNYSVLSMDPNAPLPAWGFVGQVATPVGKYELRLVHDEQ